MLILEVLHAVVKVSESQNVRRAARRGVRTDEFAVPLVAEAHQSVGRNLSFETVQLVLEGLAKLALQKLTFVIAETVVKVRVRQLRNDEIKGVKTREVLVPVKVFEGVPIRRIGDVSQNRIAFGGFMSEAGFSLRGRVLNRGPRGCPGS